MATCEHTTHPLTPLHRWLAGLCLALALPVGASEAFDPGRVGRIVDLQGDVALYDEQDGEWSDAQRNRPLVAGDRLVLQRGARAEVRIGDSVLLLGDGADLAIDTLDIRQLRLTLYDGALALRLASRDDAESTEIRTVAALIRPQRAGRYRIDQDGESTFASVWRGALEVSGHGNLLFVGAGERFEVWRDDRRGGTAQSRVARMPQDRMAAWADDRFDDEDRREARRRDVVPGPQGIPGIDELEVHGRWDTHPEHGAVWVPYGVSSTWAPFSEGRWVWMRPWGWTWVDAQPWAFATSHYGRWVQWRSRWVWWPGARHVRPVFSPAVVAWVGGPHFSVGVTLGSRPPSAWVPLQPWQPYVPMVAPRPPKPHRDGVRYPPRRLPPPSAPISRHGDGHGLGHGGGHAAGFTAGTQPGRPMPAGSVRYGSDGLPARVQPVPSVVPALKAEGQEAGRTPPVISPPPSPPISSSPPRELRPFVPVAPRPPMADESNRSPRGDTPDESRRRAPLPADRPGSREAAPGSTAVPPVRPSSEAPRPSPFSAPPRAEPARPAPAPAREESPRQERGQGSSGGDVRSPRGAERVR